MPRRGVARRAETRPSSRARTDRAGCSVRIPSTPVDSPASQRRLSAWSALAAGFSLACSGRESSHAGFSPGAGELVARPGGGYFLADSHFGGAASRVQLLELGWGRLVDVYDVDAGGARSPRPVLRDVVIGEIPAFDTDVRFEVGASKGDSRLTILRPRGAPDAGRGTFESVLRRVTVLGQVLARHDDGSAAPPVSLVPRDATLVLRFDDLLEDGPGARANLTEAVRFFAGYPPVTPQPARIVFDPSHGGLAGGEFHSTRVLVDFTLSEDEASDLPYTAPVDVIGLPASSPVSAEPNVSVRLPARGDETDGRFLRITNLAGRGLELSGPTDAAAGEIVRAFRSGNTEDVNGGRLLDRARPELVAMWGVRVEAARDDPLGPAGLGFVATLGFETACRASALPGDAVEVGGASYEVRAPGATVDLDGRLRELRLLRLDDEPLAFAQSMLGLARFQARYRPDGEESGVPPACWVSFAPGAGEPPARRVDARSFVSVRFSEPMDPDSFRAFDTLRLLRGPEDGQPVAADGIVVGSIRVDPDLQDFTFVPSLPLANDGALEYRVELLEGLLGVRDLSGSRLTGSFGRAPFALRDDQALESNGGLALRFASIDEIPPLSLEDWRGQATLDEDNGTIRPRPPALRAYTVDRGNPIPSLMQTWALGVQTPLSPLGSKLQALWRYVDFGFLVRDESLYNLDVVGMSWAPLGGAVSADVYPQFEVRLAHSRFLPDESSGPANGPFYPDSGLLTRPRRFSDNLIEPQVVVHPRQLGYVIKPADLFIGGLSTPLMPFPWNRSGAPPTSYTWRDTALIVRGGQNSPGIPLDIEVGPPFRFEPAIGAIAGPGKVPSIGLPLLWEIRTYPTDAGLGFNSLDILIPSTFGFAFPHWRAYSTGGIDESGRTVVKDPDLEFTPSGGFNPSSTPPGKPTGFQADTSVYVGQIDTVVRVSRVLTAWIDTGVVAPRYVEPVMEPRQMPGKSAVLLDFRGATGFASSAGTQPFDARAMDVYGEIEAGAVQFHAGGQWSSDITSLDGAQFLQLRLSFVNDVAGGLAAELDSLGWAFEH